MDNVIAEIFETARRKFTVLITVLTLVLTAFNKLLTVVKLVLTVVTLVLTAFNKLLTVRSPAAVGIPVKPDPSPINLPKTVPAEIVDKNP